jgi:glycosyltransferase involved in cell wall biosynthesis
MKVAYLLTSISRKAGGLFGACRRLAQSSAEQGEITVLGTEDEFTGIDIKGWAPLRPAIFRSIGPRTFGYAPGYAKCLVETAPDMAHVHGLWTFASLAGYRWHRQTNRPFMYTAHGMLEPWALRNSRWKKNIVRMLWEDTAHRSAACFHVTSEAEYRSLRHYGLSNPICIIPNGTDLPDLGQERVPPWNNCVKNKKVLFYLGRLHPKKNLTALLRAWARFQRAEVNGRMSEQWVLAIAGWDQGGHERELKLLCTELGVGFADISAQRAEGETPTERAVPSASVLFLGPRFGAEKDGCYRACDAFALSSLSEGLPMAVLEAWSYNKPVLMTAACNLPEGFTAGAAIEIGTTAEAIRDGLSRLFEMDDAGRIEMGALGRKLVSERFSWPQIGPQMRAVYEWIVGGGSAPDTVRFD